MSFLVDWKTAHEGNIFIVKQSPIIQHKIAGFLNVWACFCVSRMLVVVERNNNYLFIVLVEWTRFLPLRSFLAGLQREVKGTKLMKGNSKPRWPKNIYIFTS